MSLGSQALHSMGRSLEVHKLVKPTDVTFRNLGLGVAGTVRRSDSPETRKAAQALVPTNSWTSGTWVDYSQGATPTSLRNETKSLATVTTTSIKLVFVMSKATMGEGLETRMSKAIASPAPLPPITKRPGKKTRQMPCPQTAWPRVPHRQGKNCRVVQEVVPRRHC